MSLRAVIRGSVVVFIGTSCQNDKRSYIEYVTATVDDFPTHYDWSTQLQFSAGWIARHRRVWSHYRRRIGDWRLSRMMSTFSSTLRERCISSSQCIDFDSACFVRFWAHYDSHAILILQQLTPSTWRYLKWAWARPISFLNFLIAVCHVNSELKYCALYPLFDQQLITMIYKYNIHR